ncbi:MAG: hypothetical protein K2M06_01505, partial [Muribaculaceae bacterium]|nr:hypothetical protein [Muribaculaceae bacterium]
SCRIRTNDPEITNHVLWPTELKRQFQFSLAPGAGVAFPFAIAKLQPFFRSAKFLELFFQTFLSSQVFIINFQT